jgi:hypothetical protein
MSCGIKKILVLTEILGRLLSLQQSYVLQVWSNKMNYIHGFQGSLNGKNVFFTTFPAFKCRKSNPS